VRRSGCRLGIDVGGTNTGAAIDADAIAAAARRLLA